MRIKKSAEDYLEAILVISGEKGSVHSIDISRQLGYSKPSVSIAMKRLRENGYIDIDDGRHISLTPAGREIAERTYARHELLTYLLTKVGVSREVAVHDACEIEHDLSPETYRKLSEYAERIRACDENRS